MTRTALVPLIAAAALTLAACGSDPEPVPAPAADEATGAHMDDEGMGGEHGHDDGTFAFGAPGDPADADRTVEIMATDELAFEPASIDVAAGETITFVVTNAGSTAHEFVIGDAAFQLEHAEDMMAGGEMHAEANAVPLAPGQTEELTWTFSGDLRDLEFGCHVGGHYQAGMLGTFSEAE